MNEKTAETARVSASPDAGTERAFRWRLFIDRELQLHFVAAVMTFTLLAVGIMLTQYYYYFGRTMASNLMDPGLLQLFLGANKLLVVKLVLFLLFALAAAVALSHLIAGPLYSLQKSFAVVAGGNLRHRARLRRSDRLQKLSGNFNKMVEEFAARVARDRGAARELIDGLKALERDAPSDAVREAAARLRGRAENLTRDFQL